MNRDDVAVQRWLILGLVLSITAVAATRLFAIFRVDGPRCSKFSYRRFHVVVLLIATSFWVACLGAHALWDRRSPRRGGRSNRGMPDRAPVPHGPAMPVYNETAGRFSLACG